MRELSTVKRPKRRRLNGGPEESEGLVYPAKKIYTVSPIITQTENNRRWIKFCQRFSRGVNITHISSL